MKKIMALFLSLLVLVVTLTSCGNGSSAGVYKFQLGKDKGTHFTIMLTMTDDDVIDGSEIKGKRFEFSVQSNAKNNPVSESGSTDDEISDITNNLLSNAKCSGYYNLVKVNVPYGRQSEDKTYVKIGITGFEASDIKISQKDIENFDITPDIIEKLMYIEINDKIANVVVPVSVQDFMYQLYWYGYDIDTVNLEMIELEVKHEIGTHPTKEDIEEINKTYPDAHKGDKFRDFHTMVMGLTRD